MVGAALGSRVIYVPYIMPGFALARRVFELTRDLDWTSYDGMVLEHHGIFSFANDARESYERMIALVSLAEEYLASRGAFEAALADVQRRQAPEHRRIARRRRVLHHQLVCGGQVVSPGRGAENHYGGGRIRGARRV